jgi:hypothetical protein
MLIRIIAIVVNFPLLAVVPVSQLYATEEAVTCMFATLFCRPKRVMSLFSV